MVQQNLLFESRLGDNDNAVLDICFEDFFENDDDSKESEIKKTTSRGVLANSASFFVQNHSENNAYSILLTDFFFSSNISRHILLCVFII